MSDLPSVGKKPEALAVFAPKFPYGLGSCTSSQMPKNKTPRGDDKRSLRPLQLSRDLESLMLALQSTLWKREGKLLSPTERPQSSRVKKNRNSELGSVELAYHLMSREDTIYLHESLTCSSLSLWFNGQHQFQGQVCLFVCLFVCF